MLMFGNSLLIKENITLESIPALNATEIRLVESSSIFALIIFLSSISTSLCDGVLALFFSAKRLFL
jgi:hypothetical protein